MALDRPFYCHPAVSYRPSNQGFRERLSEDSSVRVCAPAREREKHFQASSDTRAGLKVPMDITHCNLISLPGFCEKFLNYSGFCRTDFGGQSCISPCSSGVLIHLHRVNAQLLFRARSVSLASHVAFVLESFLCILS